MSRRYSGIILADRAERIPPHLLDRSDPHAFQRVRVYTLESFYEAHWRQVPAHSIDPFGRCRLVFNYRALCLHYVKRMFDAALSGLLLICLFSVDGGAGGFALADERSADHFQAASGGTGGRNFHRLQIQTCGMRQKADASHRTTGQYDNGPEGIRLRTRLRRDRGMPGVIGPRSRVREKLTNTDQRSEIREEDIYTGRTIRGYAWGVAAEAADG